MLTDSMRQILDILQRNSRTPELLSEAELEASRAIQLDPDNVLGLAFYAEILADQQKYLQAEKYASQAVERDPRKGGAIPSTKGQLGG